MVWKRGILEKKLYPIRVAPDPTTTGMLGGGESDVADEEDVRDGIAKNKMAKAVTKVREGKPALVLHSWSCEVYLIWHCCCCCCC